MPQKQSSHKTLGLVITDGVGYKNFCLSSFLEKATDDFKKIIIYSGLPKEIYNKSNYDNIEVVELPVFVEPFKTWFWRKFKEVAHLQNHKENFGINDNLNANRSLANSIRGLATRLIYKTTSVFHSEKNNYFFEKKQKQTLYLHNVTKFCEDKLKEQDPDLLFFTHQRPPYVLPLVAAAEKLNIKTGSFIFSWDNLASKGRMAATFDFYFVWSELMKEELLHFYPNTDPNKIKVVGTPQFEPYVLERYKRNRVEFFTKFNLDPNLKTLCFSCGDVSTSKNDPLYIESIAEAILNKSIDRNINFLVRTSPAEEPDRFKYLQEKFPFINWNFPKWEMARMDHPESWSQRIPTSDDLADLRMILENSDVGINMCSTMSLDFMQFDKPVINPVFGNCENGLYNDQRFLRYAHYKIVVESNAVSIAKNKEELIKSINHQLKNPEERKLERQKLLNLQIGKPLLDTGKRITEQLLDEIE